MSLISTLVASNSATLAWTGLAQGTSWRLVGRLLLPATNSVQMRIRFGTGGGPTYITSGYDGELELAGSSGFVQSTGFENAGSINISSAGVPNTAPGVDLNLLIVTDNATWVRFSGTSNNNSTDGHKYSNHIGGGVALAAALTAIELSFSSGNITSGNASLYSIPS